MRALTRFALAHSRIIVLLWVVLAVVGGATAGITAKHLSTSYATPGEPGYAADQQILKHYGNGGDQPPTVLVVTLPSGTSMTSPGAAATVGRAFQAAGTAARARVLDFADTGSAAFTGTDGRTTFALLFTTEGAPDRTAIAKSAAAAAAPAGSQVGVTGMTQLSGAGTKSGGVSVLVESIVGGAGALIVLLLVFGSLLALLPLVVGVTSVMTTFLLVLLVTTVTQISSIAEFLVALIGLGVSIDYSLLLVTRWREEREAGQDNRVAVERAAAHASAAVLLSAGTVGLGLLALVVLPVPFLRSLGIAGALIPVVAAAVSCTLLPVILASIGPALDRVAWRHRTTESRAWYAVARVITGRPRLAALAGLAVTAALIIPAFGLHTGEASTASLSRTGPAYAALSTLEAQGVPSGALTPIEVIVNRADAASAVKDLASLPGIHAAVPGATDATTAIVDVLPAGEAGEPSGQTALSTVRTAAARLPGVIGVGGVAAETADFNHAVYGNLPLMAGIIAFLTFILLALVLRSVVLPLKAVVLNVLSVGSAFGAMVLLWQRGYGSRALWGIPATGAIADWVPIMVLAFLFGLSMDYEVFILARVREEYARTGDTRTAVVAGMGRTARLVTSAALILFLGFVSMSTAPGTDIKTLATGLGVGILIDATVIRVLLVPSLVVLLGKANWWAPAWLRRGSDSGSGGTASRRRTGPVHAGRS
jgi:RND superfamily putative drug exporter